MQLWKSVFPSSTAWNEPQQALIRKANTDDLIWVACIDREIVGMIIAGYDGVRGWIYSLGVQQAFRNRGIGKELLQTAETELVQRGCHKVNLQVRETNNAVVEFYRRCGFSVEERCSLGKALLPSKATTLPRIPLCEKFELGPVQAKDEDALVKHLNATEEFQKCTDRLPFPYTRFDAKQWVSRVSSESTSHSGTQTWTIRQIEDDSLVGGIGLMKIVRFQRAEVGYWLAKEFWGTGVTSRAVDRICQHGFTELGLRRIQANVFAFNIASTKVLQKAGFELEGRLRNECFPNGSPVDLLVFGKLSS